MRFILTFTMVLILMAPAQAQQKPAKPAKVPAKNLSAEVRLLLISLASDAASFRDQVLRARSLARIADTLWTVDADQARRLFRNAWEAAQVADQSDIPFNLGESPPNLRHEVLNLAAKRDRLLAEEFLKKLQGDEPDEPGKSSRKSDELTQRLLLANELLRAGDTTRALQFAAPALQSVNVGSIEFLTNLRPKDPPAADSTYMALLAMPRSGMNATTISLLSSYLFTPHAYVIFNSEGAADRMWYAPPAPPVDVAPQVRLAFFQAATEVLLRSQQQQNTAGSLDDYMAIGQLLPMFEAYAPGELTQTMRARFEALRSSANLVTQPEQNQISPGTDDSSAEQEQTLLDQIDRAKTSAERDDLYFRLALSSLRNDDLRARDYAGKIDESEFRKQAEAWIDTNLALTAIKKKRTDLALQLTRNGALSPIQKVWIFTQVAEIVAKTDREKALSLLDDASAEARRIEVALDRPRGLFAIARAVQLIDPSRAREAIFDAVRATNSTEGFSGEGGTLTLTIRSNTQILNSTVAIPEFDIARVFEDMANSDYESAVQLARGFQADAPRANATIAISRSILNKQIVQK